MKYSIFSLAVVATLAAAQAPADGVPKCAAPCIAKYTVGNQIAGCKQLDIGCVCKNSDFLDQVACCLADACDAAGQAAAVSYAKQICSSQGVATPDKVECKSGASPSSSAGAAPPTSSPKGDSPSPTQSGNQTTAASSTPSATHNAGSVLGAGSLVGAAVAMLFAL
ncbi:hypothetical protein PT974_09020 [Cladobotryum mycophilum]|uniref:CFEM domain-containing protein n=1 Tax=Cladobotryum mycophilum TaxID=491253 RepID=A0ABR0SG42_9HYPO